MSESEKCRIRIGWWTNGVLLLTTVLLAVVLISTNHKDNLTPMHNAGVTFESEAKMLQTMFSLMMVETNRNNMLMQSEPVHPDVMNPFMDQRALAYRMAQIDFVVYLIHKHQTTMHLNDGNLTVDTISCTIFDELDMVRLKALLFLQITCVDNIITLNKKGL